MLRAPDLVADSVEHTNLEDFGGTTSERGWSCSLSSLTDEGDLTELGEEILRLRAADAAHQPLARRGHVPPSPAISDEVVEGPWSSSAFPGRDDGAEPVDLRDPRSAR